MIKFACPRCGSDVEAPDSQVGRQQTCPACGNVSAAPQPPATGASSPAAQTVQVVRVKPGDKIARGLGISGMVLGIVACVAGLMPCCGCFISLPAAVIGLLLGLAGLLVSMAGKTGKGFPVAAIATSSAAIAVQVIWFGGMFSFFNLARQATTMPVTAPATTPTTQPAPVWWLRPGTTPPAPDDSEKPPTDEPQGLPAG